MEKVDIPSCWKFAYSKMFIETKFNMEIFHNNNISEIFWQVQTEVIVHQDYDTTHDLRDISISINYVHVAGLNRSGRSHAGVPVRTRIRRYQSKVTVRNFEALRRLMIWRMTSKIHGEVLSFLSWLWIVPALGSYSVRPTVWRSWKEQSIENSVTN